MLTSFFIFALIGFAAQIVDGALGMAYGVISSTILIATGISPAQASAAVHAAEMFTTAASGSSHMYHRNVDWQLFWRLAPFGIVGGCLGAYVLTAVNAAVARPFVTVYLGVIGAYLLFRSFRKVPTRPVPAKVVAPLGLIGGFLDAAGGGGWGPIVTTGLLGAGGAPRYVIGTVSISEFLITTAVSLTFLIAILTGHWEEAEGISSMLVPVSGLIVGGLLAAPLAAYVVRYVNETVLLRLVGVLIVLIAAYQAYGFLTK